MFDDIKNGGRAVWNDEQEKWSIPKAECSGNSITKLSSKTIQALKHNSMDQKESNKFNRKERQKCENVLTLDLDFPERTTQNYEGPNMTSRVSDILNMSIDDNCDDILWPPKSPYLRYKDVSSCNVFQLNY